MRRAHHNVKMLFLSLPHLTGCKSRHADFGFSRSAVAYNNSRTIPVDFAAGRLGCRQLCVIQTVTSILKNIVVDLIYFPAERISGRIEQRLIAFLDAFCDRYAKFRQIL